MRAEPIGGRDGEHLERMPQGLAHQFYAIEGPDGREDMRGVGALASLRLQEALLAEPLQEEVEHALLGTTGPQPAAKLAEDGVIKAGIVEREGSGKSTISYRRVEAASPGTRTSNSSTDTATTRRRPAITPRPSVFVSRTSPLRSRMRRKSHVRFCREAGPGDWPRLPIRYGHG